MNHVKRHIHLLSLIAASLLLAACNCRHTDDTFQQQRHAIEDSIAAGNDDYAMKAIARKMAEADDSTTYYLWLSTLNKAYYTDMKIDSMTATLDRIGAYLDRHADHHDQATDQLRAEWYLGKGVYNSVILGRPDSAQVYNGHAITLLLSQVMTALEGTGGCAAMMYTSDHGEDIFDDHRNLFLHASPFPSYWQLHVPLVVWTSPVYQQHHADIVTHLAANRHRPAESNSVFHTLLSMGGVATRYRNDSLSLASQSYTDHPRLFIDDHNQPRTYDACMQPIDMEQMKKRMK